MWRLGRDCFIVPDSDGHALSLRLLRGRAERATAHLLTRDEARRIRGEHLRLSNQLKQRSFLTRCSTAMRRVCSMPRLTRALDFQVFIERVRRCVFSLHSVVAGVKQLAGPIPSAPVAVVGQNCVEVVLVDDVLLFTMLKSVSVVQFGGSSCRWRAINGLSVWPK
jgi:hypothetical protein